MAAANFEIDWTTQITQASGASDATLTIPFNKPLNLGLHPNAQLGDWWLMGIAGNPLYLNVGAAATSANILHPLGRDDTPKRIKPGTVFHCLQGPGGAGSLWFVQCYWAS